MAGARIDDFQQVVRIAGFAARAILAETRPSSAAVLARAFRRDITDCGVRSDILAIARRAPSAPIGHLPGTVALIGGPKRDHPGARQLDAFFARGGTAIVEAEALPIVSSRRLASPVVCEAAPLDGIAEDLLPPGIEPLVWLDETTHLVTETEGLEVLARTRKGAAIVTRGVPEGGELRERGTFVHLATPSSPWRRQAPENAARIAPASFAARAGLRAEGLLAETATVPDELFRATLTMLVIVAELVADALPPFERN